MQFFKLFCVIFGSCFVEEYFGIILIIIVIFILLLIFWFFYKKCFEFFMCLCRGFVNYSVYEDIIYGVDFDVEIRCVIDCKDYWEVICLFYLQIFKLLSDDGWIDW